MPRGIFVRTRHEHWRFRVATLLSLAATLLATAAAEPVARVASKLSDDAFSLHVDAETRFGGFAGPYRDYTPATSQTAPRRERAIAAPVHSATALAALAASNESSESLFFVAWGNFVARDLADNELLDASPFYVAARSTSVERDAASTPTTLSNCVERLLAHEHALFEAAARRADPRASDVQVFEETRAWVVALVQHVSTHEYAAVVLGHAAAAAATGAGAGRYGVSDGGLVLRDARDIEASRELSAAFLNVSRYLDALERDCGDGALPVEARGETMQQALTRFATTPLRPPLRPRLGLSSPQSRSDAPARSALGPACVRGGLFGALSSEAAAFDDQMRRARVGDRFWYEWYLGPRDRRAIERESIDMLLERALYGAFRRTQDTPLVDEVIGAAFCVRSCADSVAAAAAAASLKHANGSRELARSGTAKARDLGPAHRGARDLAPMRVMTPALPHAAAGALVCALAFTAVSLFIAIWNSEEWRHEMHTDTYLDVDADAGTRALVFAQRRCDRCIVVAREGVLR